MLKAISNIYGRSFGGLTPETWLLSLVMLVNRSGTMVVPFMTMYLTMHVGVSITKATFVMSLFGAGSILGALLGGKLTDRFGFYPVQLIALVGGGLLFLLLGQVITYNGICIATFFLSMVNEAFRPANSVAVAHYSKEKNRTRSFSLNRLAVNLGWAVGGALGGIIAAHNYQLLFWVDGCTNIVAAVMLYWFLPPTRNAAAKQKSHQKIVATDSVFKDRQYLVFILLQIFFAACFFQLFTTLPVFYRKNWQLSETYIGFVMAINGLLIAFLEMIVVYALEGKKHALLYVSAGVFLIGISFAMLTIAGYDKHLTAMAAIVIVSAGEMLSMPFMNEYWIARTKNENRGQYAGLFTAAWSVAQITGPLVGGQLIESHGYNFFWWTVTLICIILSFFYLLVKKFGSAD